MWMLRIYFNTLQKKHLTNFYFILLGDQCQGEIFKSFCQLFQALIALTMIGFLS